jgi:P pilus assembly chaperone PapD
MNRLARVIACLVLMIVSSGYVFGQTGGMGLNPSRLELEVQPGQEKTTAFQIESPPSEVTVRGRLLLSLTDWNVNEDGSLLYADPSTLERSASPWVVFSPSAVTIESGQSHMVRVTVRAPKDAAPGVYRTALFVQERPPATPAKKGEHLVYLRLRYVFTLYVVVGKTEKHAEIVDVQVQEKQNTQVVCELKNDGTSLVRPLISMSIRATQKNETLELTHESIVLLPGNTLKQPISIPRLAAGEYEVKVEVDFQDGKALQSLTRKVRIHKTSEDSTASLHK